MEGPARFVPFSLALPDGVSDQEGATSITALPLDSSLGGVTSGATIASDLEPVGEWWQRAG